MNYRIASVLVAGALSATLSFSPARGGEEIHTPKPGNPKRTAILDAVRPTVQEMTGQPRIVFVVEKLLVCGAWAYLCGRPQTPDASNRYEDITALVFCDGDDNSKWRLVRMLGIEAGEVEDPEQAERNQWSALNKEFPNLPPALIDAVLAGHR